MRVEHAAVGMPDVFMCAGSYRLTPPLPFVPGQEVCGTVEATGDGVRTAVGSRVMGVTSFYDGRGGFAESTILTDRNAFGVPEWMPSEVAAVFRIGYSTAWTGLVRRGGLRPGEWLVVLGAGGGSGLAAVRLGVALGARVVAVASGPDKLARCRELGAEVTVDRRSGTSLARAVREATDGHGADVIYDPVGGAVANDALRALAEFGRFLVVGFASGEWVTVDGGDLTMASRSVLGVIASAGTPEENLAAHESLLALAADGSLDPVVTTVGFDRLVDAVEAVEEGTAVGKMVVCVADA